MAIKKTELYSSLWASCDELRGGMDASQYKDYVLTMLFMKYVSDKYKGDPYGMIVVPQGASFDDMVALKGDKEIGDKINKIISALAEENDLKGVIDVADFNDEDKLGKGKEMIDRLSKLIGIFEGLDLSANRADGDDLLGDAYEYLMRHFATESGKSKGQFYTPSEVSRILSKVIGIDSNTPQDATVYDPTCGSGSLLLKASDEAPRGLSIFGQEMDNATSALARMNMILHNNATAKIWKGNTIADPQWKEANGQLKTFDFAVANPPFSNKNWTSGINPNDDEFGRFSWGIPPEKNGDYTFLLHIIKSLKSTGKGAVILPHGVLFRGNAEARIRENLIKQGYIKGIIGLPANLFYGTGIPACIIVIDKEHAQQRALSPTGEASEKQGIFMVDASKGFIKDGNKNRLRSQDIHKIVDVFTKQLELPRYSRMVPLSEIASNDYNLNIPRYIDSSEPEDLHDLSAHLQGGIPNRDIDALERFWQVFPSIRATLFEPAREGYSKALVKASEVKGTILNHAEFKTFATESLQHFHAWSEAIALGEIAIGDQPKSLIFEISESLLHSYANVALLSKYDIYQILMDYWAESMQDDVYVLVQDGWQAGKVLRELVVKKGEKLKESPDLVIGKAKYKAELIPPALIVTRFFAEQQAKVDSLQSALDSASQELETYLEENSGEDGLLNDALNDKDKVTKATVTARLKLATDSDEKAALKQAKKLFDAEADAKKALKEAQDALDLAVFKHYPKLITDEIKSLIVEDKWLATLESNIVAEIERVTQQLANRVKELEERYSEPLPAVTQSVAYLSDKVAGHLKAMGLEWAL
ncbi:type I restriction-modification system subunit M [Vibrio parahaemolyticus]|jgi:type I restriction enzyme M protein|uniref:type I restriction-modification system subunit M n=1 Tax=Vibrio fluvialis TaxID=676 RepID=UPI0015583816|nr:type I restriction-modification system subunit M [Vibrio fluvialis]EJG0996697.1 type I restriction-modification system subunit M [Vibrio parahaemolyticus]MBY7907147.1 type I restriction-modification system subunit M [Vibrio fluvialis]MBY8155832.1 type I restriction-modification system subunit M [Vibrio fluvialis]MBY8197030.1 type I restriction-modification system subunit M [Vibrio fluvialis]MBY8308690.1 type I restriction-modification system subunit M [Vibrio fluvialis]